MTTRRFLSTFTLALIVPLAGACGGAGALSVEDVVARIQEAQEKIGATHVVADVTMTMPSMEAPMTMTMEQWAQGDDRMRVEYTGGTSPMDGMVMVIADGKATMYTPASNSFLETEMPDMGSAAASPEQAAAMTGQWLRHLLDTMDLRLGGIEEVAGRRTYKLEATPKATPSAEGGPGEGASTIWVDAETFYPLKLDLGLGVMRMGMTVREVEYDPEIPAETFVFTPPEGAEAMDTSGFRMPAISTTTPDEAAEQADFPLLALDGEALGFELTNTQTIQMPMPTGGEASLVSQTYEGPAGTIVVQQMPAIEGMDDMAAAMGAGGSARTVEVGDQEATLVTLGLGGTMLTWQTGETRVTLTGAVDEEALLAFAAALR